MPPPDELYQVVAMAEGPGNTLYALDARRAQVVKVTSAGLVSVFAGTGVEAYGGDGGPAVNAELDYPNGLTVDSSGDVFIASNTDFRIREVNTSGTISTIAGTGSQSSCSGPDGQPATQTQIAPGQLAVNPISHLLYFSDACGLVRMITSSGTISTIGTITSCCQGMAFDSQGDLFVTANDAVYEFVGASGSPVVVAGQPGQYGFSGDGGPPTSALLSSNPQGLAFDKRGDLFIADGGYNERIREVTGLGTQSAQISTVAGEGTGGQVVDYTGATLTRLSGPTSVAVNSSGDLFIGGSGNGSANLDSIRWLKASGGLVSSSSIIYPAMAGQDLLGEQYGGCNASESCTSAPRGEPVNTATGDFWSRETDLRVPGRGVPLVLSRAYDASLAQSAGSPGRLGYGWSFSYGMSLSQNQNTGDVTVTQENGAQDLFVPNGSGGYVSATRVLATLVQNQDGSWTFTRRARTVFTFSPSGQLTKITDLNGYATTLAYDGQGRLSSVTDPAGRSLSFSYDSSNRIAKISDPAGRTVSYSYDSAGNLHTVVDVDGGTTTYGYGASHRLTSITDPRGNTVLTNAYDGAGQVTAQTDALSRKTTFSYAPGVTTTTSPAGNKVQDDYAGTELYKEIQGVGSAQQATWSYSYDPTTDGITSITDPNKHSTTNTYNSAGDLLATTNGLGKQTSFAYDSLNDLTSVTDPNGVTTTFSYDSAGTLLSVSTPLSGTGQTQTWTYTYGDSSHPGDVTKVTDPDGQVTTLSYDTYGNLASATDAVGDEETFIYDGIGRRTSMVRPDGNAPGANPANYTTTYNYDPAGNLLKVTNPLGHSTSYTYDADQNLASATDADGNKTTYTYDAANQLTTTTRADGSTLTNGYDQDGNLASQTDGLGHTTSYVYDPLDRVTSVTDPLSRTTTYTYDGAGNLKTTVDPQSRTTTYGYNAANWPTAVSYSDGHTPNVSYGYDNDGQRTSMTDGTGSTSYTYDSLHRLTTTTDGAGYTISYGYDLVGNKTSITYPNGKTITQKFDPANRVASITDWLGGATSFGYDADSNLTATTFPATSGNSDSYAYDHADQLTSIGISQATSTLATLSYTRDPLGLVTNETQTGLPGASNTNYSYNQLDQLATAGTSNYGYDKADNLTQLDGNTGYTYDNASELTSSPTASYAYDQLGERTSSTPTGGSSNTYGYNQAGRLTSYTPPSATATTFAYNGDGLRATKTTGSNTSSFTWDQTSSIPSLLGDGQNYYIYGPDGLQIEQISPAGTPSYLHHDQLGSTRLITNQTGTAAATFTYNPYGALNASTGTAATPIGYAGQYTDPETGLQYDQARYYDPSTGQFISRDPLAPVTQEAYAYASDTPVNAIDPTGLDNTRWATEGGAAFYSLCAQSPGSSPCSYASLSDVLNMFNPVRYYEAEIKSYENGCGYWSSVTNGLQGAVVAATDVAGAAGILKGLVGVTAAEEASGEAGTAAEQPTKITGYTSHGLNQAISRDNHGVSPQSILDTMRDPQTTVMQANGRWKLTGASSVVVVEPDGTLVTTWATARSGWRW